MKVRIRDICTACGVCLDTCPDILEMEQDDIVRVTVNKIPPEFEETIQQAADECPIQAIIVE